MKWWKMDKEDLEERTKKWIRTIDGKYIEVEEEVLKSRGGGIKCH